MSRLDDSEMAPRTVGPGHREPQDAGPLRLPWAGLLALSAAAFIDVVTDLAPAGLLPGMSASFGVPEGHIGILVSGYAAASALGAIPLTALLRGLPRRRVLCSVLAGFALLDAMTAVSPSYVLTFACRLLAGALGGVLWAMLAPAAARFVPAERRGRAVAIVLAGITVALALGIPAAPLGWRTVFVLFVFGLSTLGGVTLVAILADRHLRATLLGVLCLFAAVLLTLGGAAHLAVALYAAVVCWGAAFGAAPTLIQIALIDAAGPARADVATAMQTAVYNVGIAAGSFAGGLALDHGGAGTLPWVLPQRIANLWQGIRHAGAFRAGRGGSGGRALRGPVRGSGGLVAGCLPRASRARRTAVSSCGSRPCAQSAGVMSTSTSGSTP
jgi:predicted MFS family arabinose efflux permease